MDRATVIVALPPVDDQVNKVSSEKVPHLTLLYLGDADLSAEAVLYVQHACAELSPFGLSVDFRGKLGEDEADVLFFEDSAWDIKRVQEFRHYLLLNDEIKRAYDVAVQFPEWNPHLTLGYPEAPADEDDEDRRIRYVDFDRVAVWSGDFEGPEFRLKYDDYMSDSGAVAWGDMSPLEKGAAAAGEMFHYGVKGMKWGVRKADSATARAAAMRARADRREGKLGNGGEQRKARQLEKKANVLQEKRARQIAKDEARKTAKAQVQINQRKPGQFAKSKGGEGLPLSDDAINSLIVRQKARSSTTDALSNKEIQLAVTRMNLEQQYSNLSFQSDRRSAGLRFASGLLGQKRYGKKRPFADSTEESGEQVRKAIEAAMAAKKGA